MLDKITYQPFAEIKCRTLKDYQILCCLMPANLIRSRILQITVKNNNCKIKFFLRFLLQQKKDTGRADRVNTVFLSMSQLAGKLEENKKGEISFETNFPV